MPKRGVRVWLWVLGGCLSVLVLTAAVAGYGIYYFVQGFTHGTITCLPADFPRYAGSKPMDESFDATGMATGCHMVFQSGDDVATVTAFYRSKLNTGSWRLTPDVDLGSQLFFQPPGGGPPFGEVQVAAAGAHTDITVDVSNSTCLPLGFPIYPKALFGGESLNTETTNACHIVFVSDDTLPAVTAYYERKLRSGSWQVTSSAPGEVGWRLLSGKRVTASGTVAIRVIQDRAKITIDSSS